MANSVILDSTAETTYWPTLKRAIAASSGYQTWLVESEVQQADHPQEDLVLVYLRQTLATLAY
jgi:hypothetical protein